LGGFPAGGPGFPGLLLVALGYGPHAPFGGWIAADSGVLPWVAVSDGAHARFGGWVALGQAGALRRGGYFLGGSQSCRICAGVRAMG